MRILVIDNDRAVVRSIQKLLRGDKVSGETDAVAGRGRIAQAEEDGVAFAVVLCDVDIDSKRGIDILREARDRRNPPLFIFMTTYATVVESAWLGDGVLIKPFRSDEVLNTIAQLMLKRSRAITRRMRATLPN